jgi:hypothetical protein
LDILELTEQPKRVLAPDGLPGAGLSMGIVERRYSIPSALHGWGEARRTRVRLPERNTRNDHCRTRDLPAMERSLDPRGLACCGGPRAAADRCGRG